MTKRSYSFEILDFLKPPDDLQLLRVVPQSRNQVFRSDGATRDNLRPLDKAKVDTP